MKKRLLVLLALILSIGMTERRGDRLYRGEPQAQLGLADAVAHWVSRHSPSSVGSPGGSQFDGEWALVTCQMAVIGLAQVVEQHPETRDRYLPPMQRCLSWMLTDEAQGFAAARWGGQDPDAQAWRGYTNFALARYRRIDDAFADEHDALRARLAAALSAPVHEFQTYPGETFPPDLATVAGSLALYDPPAGLPDWLARFEATAVDAETGLLHQRLSPVTGEPVDAPRGSGSAFAAFFLHPADPDLSRQLTAALSHRTFLGFGGIREYAPGVFGMGDIDSGPVIFGVGVSATGFAIAGARLHRDEARYRSLVRTATLFGVPIPWNQGQWHLTGGGIGNAIMLAMLTAG